MSVISPSRRPLVALLIVVAFLVFVTTFARLNGVPLGQEHREPDGSLCVYEKKFNFIGTALPLLASAGILIGALTYYFTYQKAEQKETRAPAPSKEILLRFLNPDERAIVDFLIREDGKALQSELARLPGMGKVKAHRVLQHLVERRVVESLDHGNTNLVRFTKEVKETLL